MSWDKVIQSKHKCDITTKNLFLTSALPLIFPFHVYISRAYSDVMIIYQFRVVLYSGIRKQHNDGVTILDIPRKDYLYYILYIWKVESSIISNGFVLFYFDKNGF